MFTAGSQKARSRSRRHAGRLVSTDEAPALAPECVFEEEDDFVLGEAAEPFAFVGNTAPPPCDAELVLEAEDEAPPFDAPELDDEIFQTPQLHKPPLVSDTAPIAPPTSGEPLLLTTPSAVPALGVRADEKNPLAPAPPISIHICWDRTETAETLIAPLLKHPLLRRARIEVDRGGAEAAAAVTETPDLYIIDTSLSVAAMLAHLDRLAGAVKQGAKIIVLGAVNDITLLRELAQRGVNEYIVPPLNADALAQSICRLYAETDNSRVIAVIGARGGVGASTIAHNLAWSIAERQHAGAAIVDLDLSFGAAALAFGAAPSQSLADAFDAKDEQDDSLDAIAVRPTPRLQIYSAPVTLQRTFELNESTLQNLVTRVRRTSPYIVLDLPHAWTSWIKEALLKADDVIIVAGPDLASLSSAKSMLEALKTARPDIAPLIVMSMVGVPKRPEITFKDFSGALGLAPPFSFAFDPALLGQAALESRMIGEIAPTSKMALELDDLAAFLTGRDPISEPAPSRVESKAMPQAPIPEGVQGTLQRLKRARGRLRARGEDYLARARNAARERAKLPPTTTAQRRTSPALRAATALVAMLTLCAWNIEHLRPEAHAAAPARTAPPPPAAPQVDHAADFSAARAAFEADPHQGLQRLRAVAEAGFAPAQYHLAKLYERGEGVSANLDEARAWTERAANAGEVHAMHDLGVYYARGEGADANPVTAFRWFRQAAAHGLTDSQYNLGILYEQGRGVTADPAEALFWFTLAAAHGDEAAAQRAAALEARVTPIVVEQARARAQRQVALGNRP